MIDNCLLILIDLPVKWTPLWDVVQHSLYYIRHQLAMLYWNKIGQTAFTQNSRPTLTPPRHAVLLFFLHFFRYYLCISISIRCGLTETVFELLLVKEGVSSSVLNRLTLYGFVLSWSYGEDRPLQTLISENHGNYCKCSSFCDI